MAASIAGKTSSPVQSQLQFASSTRAGINLQLKDASPRWQWGTGLAQ